MCFCWFFFYWVLNVEICTTFCHVFPHKTIFRCCFSIDLAFCNWIFIINFKLKLLSLGADRENERSFNIITDIYIYTSKNPGNMQTVWGGVLCGMVKSELSAHAWRCTSISMEISALCGNYIYYNNNKQVAEQQQWTTNSDINGKRFGIRAIA